jgi:hypothetical protein
LLINDSLVFSNPTDTSTVDGSTIDDISRNNSQLDITTIDDISRNNSQLDITTIDDISRNNSHIDITTTIYLNETHFMFIDGSTTQMLKTDSMNNVSTTATEELLNFTVCIWFYIQNSNDKTEEQT